MMALEACRECQKEVSTQARTCPHCGAPVPTRSGWKGSGVDWKSSQTLFGYPLLHVAFGRDEHGRLRVAKGIIAIGQFAVGAITVAQFGVGLLFGFGQFIVGLTAIAPAVIRHRSPRLSETAWSYRQRNSRRPLRKSAMKRREANTAAGS